MYVKLLTEKDPGSTWNKNVKSQGVALDRFVTKKKDTSDDAGAASSTVEKQNEASGPYHSVLVEERVWTANWINQYVLIKTILIAIGTFSNRKSFY